MLKIGAGKFNIGKKAAELPQNLLQALKNYKGSHSYTVNEKLRGVCHEPLTSEERDIVELFPQAPMVTLPEDKFVFRGVGISHDFNPLEALKPGEIFTEKGFTSISKFKATAKLFRYSSGIMEKILLPKGTKFIDIDAVLKANLNRLYKLDDMFASAVENIHKHEWILLPNKKFEVLDYSPVKTYNYFTDSDGITHKFDDGGRGIFNLALCA